MSTAAPAYEYQRAPYQNYNVSYAENILLVDPFRPELGRLDPGGLAARLVTNLARMPAALGEAVSAPKSYWQSALERTNRLLGQHLLPVGVVWVPILGFGALVVAGVVILTRRGAWLMVFIILVSVGLVCMTPWPDQFGALSDAASPFPDHRRRSGLGPTRCRAAGARNSVGRPSWTRGARQPPGARLHSCRPTRRCDCSLIARARRASSFVPGQRTPRRPLLLSRPLLAGLGGSRGLDRRARATRRDRRHEHHRTCATCSRAVVPSFQPMEIDPAARASSARSRSRVICHCRRVRAIHDFSRRYALPAVESHPASWRVVHAIDGTRIYEHTAGTQ